jgi:hypothetical protein
MYEAIKTSSKAMASVHATLKHAGINCQGWTADEKIRKSLSIAGPCHHTWDRPYRGEGTRICTTCGGLQNNEGPIVPTLMLG